MIQVKDPESIRFGREGGAIGGRRRAEKLSPERRSEIARKAAEARWHRTGKPIRESRSRGMDAATVREHLSEIAAEIARNEEEHKALASLQKGYEGLLRLYLRDARNR